jgi:hypothetical protein
MITQSKKMSPPISNKSFLSESPSVLDDAVNLRITV